MNDDERRRRWRWPELVGCLVLWLVGILAPILIARQLYIHLTR